MYLEYMESLFELVSRIEFTNREGVVFSYEEGIEKLVSIFAEAKRNLQKVFFIGNGGSAAIASHMTVDFMKNGGLRTCSMNDGAVLTCLGNDYGYDQVFAKQLEALAEEGDLLTAISSSGNSVSILEAIRSARTKGCRIITFTGFLQENHVRKNGDFNVYVPVSDYGPVETIHNLILQQTVDMMPISGKSIADKSL